MKGIYQPIAEHLQQFCKEGDFIIYRDAFRWKQLYWNGIICEYDGQVLSNHFECMSLEHLAEDFGYEIDWDTNMHHVAIVRKLK